MNTTTNAAQSEAELIKETAKEVAALMEECFRPEFGNAATFELLYRELLNAKQLDRKQQ